VLLLLLEMAAIWALGFVYGAGFVPPLLVLMWAPLGVVNFFLGFYLVAIFVMIVISWVAPGTSSPAAYLLYQITEPFMAPFRKLLPSMGGLDFTPMIAVLILYISRNFVRWAGYSVNLQELLVIGF
jgi:YggT family protein